MRLLDPLAGLDQPGSAPRGQRGASGGVSSIGRFQRYGARASEGGRAPGELVRLHLVVVQLILAHSKPGSRDTLDEVR